MSKAIRDLPDPLEPSPTLAVSNPDDLLSQLADDAIDQLMAEAEAGKSTASRRPPIHFDEPAPVSPMPVTSEADAKPNINGIGDEEEDEPAYPPNLLSSSAASPVPAVADRTTDSTTTASNRSHDAAEHEKPPEAVVTSEHDASNLPPEPHPTSADAPVLDASRAALLYEPAGGQPSVLLLPLRLLNAPFLWMSDDARRVFGLIGIVTLVPAAVAIAYVLWLKKH